MKQEQPFWFKLLMIICGMSAVVGGMVLVIIGLLLVPYSSPLLFIGAFTSIGGFVLLTEKIIGEPL